MAKKRMSPEELRKWREESEALHAMLSERIEYHQQKLSEEKAAQADWEARRARRAERIHRILTLGLGRAA